jgi:hypothetical protein
VSDPRDSFHERAALEARSLVDGLREEAKNRAAEIVRDRLVALYVEQFEAALRNEPRALSDVEQAWYVYGITAGMPRSPGVGVGGAAVEALECGPVAALGSWVDRDPTSWGIGSNGDVDIDVLGPLAGQHETVLERALERGPVIPFRFGIVYPSPDDLRPILEQHIQEVRAELDRVTGKAEWGLTVRSADRPQAEMADGDSTSYLARRRDEVARAARQRDEARAVVATLHERLAEVSAGDVVHRSRRIQAADEHLVLNASYLVDRRDEPRFRSLAADALAATPEDIQLSGELTGPWPPYNFVDLQLQGASG